MKKGLFSFDATPGVVPPGSITNSELANMAARTVKVNATNSSASPQDLQGSTPFDVLQVNAAGNGLEWSAVAATEISLAASPRLVGRTTAGAGASEEISVDASLGLAALTLSRAALTGDVTATAGSNATTIAAGVVTNAKMANMAAHTVKGNGTAGSTAPQDLTFDATLANPTTSTIGRAALTGDVTAAAGSNATAIAANAVTNAQFRQSAGLSVVGRSANTTGNVADITGVTVGHVLQVIAGPTIGFAVAPVPGSNTVPVTSLTFAASPRLAGRTTASAGAGEEISVDTTLTLSALTLARAAITGPVAVAAGSNTSTMTANSTALAALANAGAQYDIIGRKTASGGAWEDCTRAQLNLARVDVDNAFTTSQTVGAGTGQRQLVINGGTGTSDNALLVLQGAGAAATIIGNRSGILGGAYDAETTIWPVVAGSLSILNIAAVRTFQVFGTTGVSLGNLAAPGVAGALNATSYYANGNLVVDTNGLLRARVLTVGTLPAAVQGAKAHVTDALAPAFGVAVAAGGAVSVPVYGNNAPAWFVG